MTSIHFIYKRNGTDSSRKTICSLICFSLLLMMLFPLHAQVYSPKVLCKGQIDSSNLTVLAKGICEQAGAYTPREKAEAIWRFFLTDGRFVAPGFWYHIAGWAYEEPGGEVLDPLKLLNSYGFGLCYQVAPLLEAVYKAAGFEDARVWFLTGHTVTEVFYDGAYHHYDSDMLGYTTIGSGDPKKQPVASVSQIALDGSILLGKLLAPNKVDATKVDSPWYPADVNESAIGGLTEAFTTRNDNWLFPPTRYAEGHRMEFALRPGEKLIRYFQPEEPNLYYLPYKFDGQHWEEFPRELPEYKVLTQDGPQSQKDARRWATGCIEYHPVLKDRHSYFPVFNPAFNDNLDLSPGSARSTSLHRQGADRPGQAVFEMRSPYVLIDAKVAMEAAIAKAEQQLTLEVSVDGGHQWELMASRHGPFQGRWEVIPEPRIRSQHGSLSLVGGHYSYLVRLRLSGSGSADSPRVKDLSLTSRFQLNPRTLPRVAVGRNEMVFAAGEPEAWHSYSPDLERLRETAFKLENVRIVSESGQVFLWPAGNSHASIFFELASPDGGALRGFEAGARFLDLRDGLAPDKLNAEVRQTGLPDASAGARQIPKASLSWAAKAEGPYITLWEYDPLPKWPNGQPVEKLLRWPEVLRSVQNVPTGLKKVYLRYSFSGMGLDSPRWNVISSGASKPTPLIVTHQWFANGRLIEHTERVENSGMKHSYNFNVEKAADLRNHAIVFYCPPALSHER
jgi:hypothetical protein